MPTLESDQQEPTVVGINFGTSYSSIAYINQDNRPDCIANEDGDRQIASVVTFSGQEELTGTRAQEQIVRSPNRTVAQFRALIGKTFSEMKTQINSAAPVINNNDIPSYSISPIDDSEPTIFSVHDITVKYLRRLRESGEAFLGKKITGAVLSIPSFFTELQREALKEAAKEAGIHVLQLIHESSAAALAYNIGQAKNDQDKTILIGNLGGHNFDVTVLNVRSGIYTILASVNDPDLGGAQLDELLVTHFSAEFKKKSKIDIASNQKALAKLRAACEVTKRTLSQSPVAPCSVESLAEGIDFHSTINRTRFDIMTTKFFNRCTNVIEDVLKKADLDASEINEVLLTGGSARVPKLTAKVRSIFPEETVFLSSYEPDEATVYGCAIQANLIGHFDQEDIDASVHPVVTLTPHTKKHIGVVVANGSFHTIIPRDTPLPVRRVVEFSNSAEGQKEAYFAVWEAAHVVETEKIPVETPPPVDGEDPEEPAEPEIVKRVVIKPETLLAELVLSELPEKKVGEAKLEATITVDAEAKMTVVLREKSGTKIVKVEV